MEPARSQQFTSVCRKWLPEVLISNISQNILNVSIHIAAFEASNVNGRRKEDAGMPKQSGRPSSALSFAILAVMLLTMAAGSYYVYSVWRTQTNTMKSEAIGLAESAASFVSLSDVLALEGSLQDLEKPEYLRTKSALTDLKERLGAAFTYILDIRGGRLLILADSEPEGSQAYSPPGDEYSEADPAYFEVFTLNEGILTDTVTDRWGAWRSALAPIRDSSSGLCEAVLAIDYPADFWTASVNRSVLPSVITAISTLLLLLALYSLASRTSILRSTSERLRQSEELFRTLFVEAPLGIAAIDDDDRLSMVNPAFEKITGRMAEELKSIEWGELTYPSDSGEYAGMMTSYKSEPHGQFNMDKRIVKPDGTSSWVNMSVKKFALSPGQEGRYLLMIMDIDEQRKASDALKESERSKSVLLSNLPGLAYRCDYDRDWTMRFISPGCFKLTGYRPKSLLGNSEVSYNDLIAPEYRQAIWEEWERVISRKLPFRYEYEIITAIGDRKWVFEQGQAILATDGSVEALEGLIIDINDRKRKEEEVRYLNDRDYLTGLHNRRYFEKSRRIMNSSGKLPLSIIVGDINGLKFINDALGHAEGDILIMETSKLLKNAARPQDVLSRTGGDEFMLLMPSTGRSEAARVMEDIRRNVERHNASISGSSFYISISLGFASKDHPFEDFDRVMREAEDMMYRGKLADHRQAYRLIVDSIMDRVYAKSHENPEHAKRIMVISSSIARMLGLSEQEISDLALTAMLHDIGNISVTGDILAKQSSLTDDEWAEVRRHPMVGYRIAKASEELSDIADYVLSHHERWDGTGYPNGRKAEEIPLLSRIIAVADAFDAMTHDRPYRKAMTEAEALEEIERQAGSQFDPEVASALIRHFAQKLV